MEIEEIPFFLHELHRLLLDYKKCPHDELKNEIAEDIWLLKTALREFR